MTTVSTIDMAGVHILCEPGEQSCPINLEVHEVHKSVFSTRILRYLNKFSIFFLVMMFSTLHVHGSLHTIHGLHDIHDILDSWQFMVHEKRRRSSQDSSRAPSHACSAKCQHPQGLDCFPACQGSHCSSSSVRCKTFRDWGKWLKWLKPHWVSQKSRSVPWQYVTQVAYNKPLHGCRASLVSLVFARSEVVLQVALKLLYHMTLDPAARLAEMNGGQQMWKLSRVRRSLSDLESDFFLLRCMEVFLDEVFIASSISGIATSRGLGQCMTARCGERMWSAFVSNAFSFAGSK